MNPLYPGLAEYATGPELKRVSDNFLARKSAGEVFRGSFDLAPKVTALTDGRATVVDCSFDHTGIYDAGTGQLKKPKDTQRRLDAITMTKVVGQWKVEESQLLHYGCAPGDTA
jgi:hypothetical protein